MSSRPVAITAAAAAALLAGCDTIPPQAGSLDSGFGEVTKYNAAVQTVDPEPVYSAESAQPGYHGEKAANATKRYRTDQVKDTEPAGDTTRRAGRGNSGPR